MKRILNALKAVLFIFIFIVLLSLFNRIVTPKWPTYNNYSTVEGFYMQPENTINTIFLGSSVVVNGFIPIQMYEQNGICAYNLATEQQPVMISYYWLREAYKYHPDTLKYVILDVSMMRRNPDKAFYTKGTVQMKMSVQKMKMMADYSEDIGAWGEEVCSIVSYHTRWKELGHPDFEIHKENVIVENRGYHYASGRIGTGGKADYDEIPIVNYYMLEDTKEGDLDEETVWFLDKMIQFCNERGIRLLLIKTPQSAWTDSNHLAIENLAKNNGLEFLDCNFEPLLSETEYDIFLDSVDGAHPNYDGAEKLTAWIGAYLEKQDGYHNIKEDDNYHFMEEEQRKFRKRYAKQYLEKITFYEDYLEQVVGEEDYTVFITIMDDGANAISERSREHLRELGLMELAEIQFRESYLSVIEGGKVMVEERGNADQYSDLNIEEDLDEDDKEPIWLRYTYHLKDESIAVLKSGGFHSGNLSSCMINKKEYSPKGVGMNIVVYDHILGDVIDAVNFNTYVSEERETVDFKEELTEMLNSGINQNQLPKDYQRMLLYERRALEEKFRKMEIKYTNPSDALKYINTYRGKDYLIFISAMDDAASGLSKISRRYLKKQGLEGLSNLECRDSYLGIIDNDTVVYEVRRHDTEPIACDGLSFQLVSGGFDSGNTSSIMIDGKEYSPQSRGLNIVVYDKYLGKVIGKAVFDTCISDIEISNETSD